MSGLEIAVRVSGSATLIGAGLLWLSLLYGALCVWFQDPQRITQQKLRLSWKSPAEQIAHSTQLLTDPRWAVLRRYTRWAATWLTSWGVIWGLLAILNSLMG